MRAVEDTIATLGSVPLIKTSLSNSSTPLKSPEVSEIDEDIKIYLSPGNKSKRNIVDRAGVPRKRSRFGCEECKKRRVKCDEAKPKCNRCIEKGIRCNYNVILRFREDYVGKGRKFGREGVWTKKGSSESFSALLVSKGKDSTYLKIKNPEKLTFINFYTNEMKDRSLHLRSSLGTPIIPTDVKNMDSDTESLSFALTYYMDYVSPIFNPFGNNSSKAIAISNNFVSRNVLIESGLDLAELMQYSQIKLEIFYLVLSLGCVYLSKLGDADYERHWLEKSQSYKKLGINIIGNAIKSSQSESQIDENKNFSIGLLLSLVLLMLHEVADNCDQKWRAYLKTCKFLVFSKKFTPPHNSLEKSLLKFSLELLNYHESMGRTACKDNNSYFLLSEEIIEAPLNDRTESTISISWMGCDKNLVNVISDITDLSFERFIKGISEENYRILCNDIRLKLVSMDLEVNKKEFSMDLNSSEISSANLQDMLEHDVKIDPSWNLDELCFVLACEVKRLAASIYLECCLFNRTPEDKEIQSMIFFLYRMLRFIIIQADVNWSSTLLWSLFVTSAEISIHSSTCDDLRFLTLRMLERIEAKSLGNVKMAREIILSIWKRRDMDNYDENSFGYTQKIKKKSQGKYLLGFINDWETYVANESINITLA